MLPNHATEIFHVERTLFPRMINNNGTRTFEFGKERGKSIPSRVVVGYLVNNRVDSHRLDNSTFDCLVISTVDIIYRIGS